MSGNSVHLMISPAEGTKDEELKAAFVPLNGAFQLHLIHTSNQLSSLSAGQARIFIFSGSSDNTTWQESARQARLVSSSLYFILVSDEETSFSAITQGADLLIQRSEVQQLPLIIGALLRRNIFSKSNNPEKAVTPDLPVMNKLDELKMKNTELEKINYELDRFVYSASHDLRAPLTSVLGLLDILRNEIPAGENQHLINLMEESILKLDTTIRDIVAYSRNNRTDVSIEALRIQPIVEEILRELKYLESNQFALVECVNAQDDGVFPGDKIRLTTVLKNLISNAIRFRHPARKPVINIQLHRNANHLDLIVADNGLGINQQHLEKIFDMFYRTSDQSAGSGLGLYIVRETIRKMNGSIEVQSTVNQGTIFHISLPLQGDQIITS